MLTLSLNEAVAYAVSNAPRMCMCVIPPAVAAIDRARPFPLGDRMESDEACMLLCALPLPKAVVG